MLGRNKCKGINVGREENIPLLIRKEEDIPSLMWKERNFTYIDLWKKKKITSWCGKKKIRLWCEEDSFYIYIYMYWCRKSSIYIYWYGGKKDCVPGFMWVWKNVLEYWYGEERTFSSVGEARKTTQNIDVERKEHLVCCVCGLKRTTLCEYWCGSKEVSIKNFLYVGRTSLTVDSRGKNM